MKKFFSFLLVLGVFCLPLLVNAYEESLTVSSSPISTETTNGVDKKTYSISVSLTNNTENHVITQKIVKFRLGKAITSATCGDFGEFVATTTNNGTDSEGRMLITCQFDKNGSTATGNSFQIGTIVVNVPVNTTEDCSIEVINGGSQGTSNPETGASLPMIIIATGLVIGAGVYYVTKKRTKLYKI
ncbi:MAG: hypothetical protein ACI4XR_01160 [Bacilli bacterium]